MNTSSDTKVKGITIPVTEMDKDGKALVEKLQAANKVAGEARKALLAYTQTKYLKDLKVPDGKVLKVNARYGNVWIGLVDAKASAKPKKSLQDWLAEQAA